MQTILDLTSYILISVVGGVAGAFLGLVIQYEVRVLKVRKNVLKAIKDLNIEDELAKCPVGLNAKLFNAIKTYLREHNMRDPFVGQGSVCEMMMLISELREQGKVKPLQPVEKTEESVKETPVKLFDSSAFYQWLEKWGFKKNLNMLQLMQYRLDEYQGNLGQVLHDSVYARPAANEYLVTIHGEYVIVDASTLTKMEADFYAEKVSPNNHLFAIPKDWVDGILNKHPELVLTDVD